MSLNEKEVQASPPQRATRPWPATAPVAKTARRRALTMLQIWFQNRRQNDRRKSRPLTAQEIAALRSGGMQIISDPTLPASSVLADAPYPQAPGPVVHTPNRPAPAASHGFDSPRLREQACSTGGGSPGNGDSEKENKEGALESEQGIKLEPAVHPSGLSQSFPGTTGYLANRWNASTFSTPSMARDDSQRYNPLSPAAILGG